MSQNVKSQQNAGKTQPSASAANLNSHHVDHDPKTLKVRQKAERMLADKNYDHAIDLLNSLAQIPEIRNLKGVCLLRMGAAERAVQLYRSYLIVSGTTNLRTDVDQSHIINYATALLLSGRPSGCLEILSDLGETSHPAAARLRAAIDAWSRTLGFWQRFNWWIGKMEPKPCVVPLSFVPGEYTSTVPAVTTDSAPGPSAQSSTQSVL